MPSRASSPRWPDREVAVPRGIRYERRGLAVEPGDSSARGSHHARNDATWFALNQRDPDLGY